MARHLGDSVFGCKNWQLKHLQLPPLFDFLHSIQTPIRQTQRFVYLCSAIFKIPTRKRVCKLPSPDQARLPASKLIPPLSILQDPFNDSGSWHSSTQEAWLPCRPGSARVGAVREISHAPPGSGVKLEFGRCLSHDGSGSGMSSCWNARYSVRWYEIREAEWVQDLTKLANAPESEEWDMFEYLYALFTGLLDRRGIMAQRSSRAPTAPGAAVVHSSAGGQRSRSPSDIMANRQHAVPEDSVQELCKPSKATHIGRSTCHLELWWTLAFALLAGFQPLTGFLRTHNSNLIPGIGQSKRQRPTPPSAKNKSAPGTKIHLLLNLVAANPHRLPACGCL